MEAGWAAPCEIPVQVAISIIVIVTVVGHPGWATAGSIETRRFRQRNNANAPIPSNSQRYSSNLKNRDEAYLEHPPSCRLHCLAPQD
jgi:hypothetical protein